MTAEHSFYLERKKDKSCAPVVDRQPLVATAVCVFRTREEAPECRAPTWSHGEGRSVVHRLSGESQGMPFINKLRSEIETNPASEN